MQEQQMGLEKIKPLNYKEKLDHRKTQKNHEQDESHLANLPTKLLLYIVNTVRPIERFDMIYPLCLTCNKFWDIFIQEVQTEFLQAVIDDDRYTVQSMLDANPELLLINPPNGLLIESKYTRRKFYAESPLYMACRRKQIEMVEILLPYYTELVNSNKLEQSIVEDDLLAWKSYDLQKNEDGKDEISIPDEYAKYAQSLINAFMAETFPNGVPGEGITPINVNLSEDTESALSFLLNILVPKNPQRLDNHIDVELFLLATFKAYLANIDSFRNDNQRDQFCIRVIGLIQRALIPETGKSRCQRLYGSAGKINIWDKRPTVFKLYDGEEFSRVKRPFRNKTLGSTVWMCWSGHNSVGSKAVPFSLISLMYSSMSSFKSSFRSKAVPFSLMYSSKSSLEDLCQEKDRRLSEIIQKIQSQENQHHMVDPPNHRERHHESTPHDSITNPCG